MSVIFPRISGALEIEFLCPLKNMITPYFHFLREKNGFHTINLFTNLIFQTQNVPKVMIHFHENHDDTGKITKKFPNPSWFKILLKS